MKVALVCTIVIALVLAGFVTLAPRVAAAVPAGGYVNTMTWYRVASGTQAVLDIARPGTDPSHLDLWLYNLLTPSDIAAAKTNPAVRTIDVAGSWDNLFVNPLPVNASHCPCVQPVNPFAKRELREALNYLVDRDFMTREVTPTKNSPMFSMFMRADPEYGREAVFYSEIERQFAFNAALGKKMIFDALNADPDYSFVSGKWQWKGSPVVINMVIRIEDERRNVGDYVAGILEGLGFTVNRLYNPGGPAFGIVYDGPPDTGAWQIYTEGIATLATTAWSDSQPWGYFVGDFFGSAVFTLGGYKPAPALKDAADKLFTANYASLAERQTLLKTAVSEAMKDGTRVFLVNNAVFALSTRAEAFVYDLIGGTWSPFTLRTIRFPLTGPTGSCPSYPCGDLRVGQRLINLEGWQPWRIDNLYDALAMAPGPLTDVGVYPNPHTGYYMPVRSTFNVNTAGASGSMAVPANAWTWDNTTGGFKTVTSGTTAKSAVTFTYTFGKWHDNTTFDITDVLYETALAFRRARGDIHAVDGDAAGSGTQLFASTFKGLTYSATSMTVYLDYWHPDPSTIASTASIFPATPWTASELGLSTLLLGTRPCRLSSTTANADGVDQLDMTKGNCLTAMDGNLPGYVAASHRPPGFDASMIPDTTVATKWAALQTFRTNSGHFFVSNGPYYLSSVDASTSQYRMTRDANYPFTADHWDQFLVPKIPRVEFEASPPVLIGAPATFTVNVAVSSTPYDDFNMTWLLVNPATSALLFQGVPTRVGAGQYQITLSPIQTASLQAGAYELRTITVGAEAAPPVFATQSFLALPDVDRIVAEQNAKILTLENELDAQEAAQANATAALQAQLGAAQTTAAIGIGVAVVGVIAALVAIMMSRRMQRKPEEPPKQSEEL